MYPAGYILIYNYYKPLNAERQTQRVSSAAVGTGRVQTETAQHGGRGGAELRWALSYLTYDPDYFRGADRFPGWDSLCLDPPGFRIDIGCVCVRSRIPIPCLLCAIPVV